MTPRDLAAYFRRVADRLPEKVQDAERESLDDLKAAAVRRTSGKRSKASLRRRPFAKRHGAPLLDPDQVGEASGGIRGSWETDGPKPHRGGLRSTLTNTDPKAAMLAEGTDTMFARRPDEAARREIQPARQRRLADAIEESFTDG